MDVAVALTRCALFRDLRPEALAPLVAAGRRRSYAPRAYVWREGETADSLFAVLSGRLHVLRSDPDGSEIVIHVLWPGSTAGEPALFQTSARRVTDAQAAEPSECFALPRARLLACLDGHPPVARRMMEQLAGIAREHLEQLAALAFRDIAARVAAKLVELADGEHAGPVAGGGEHRTLRLSQRTLAGMTAASRENVNRTLARLVTAGVIAQRAGEISILDMAALRTWAV